MVREATITQEAVNAIVERIRADGGKPTARKVREELGRGSMATVLKFLQSWQDSQVRQADEPVTLPQALQRVIVDFINQEVASAKKPLETALADAQQAGRDLITESERQAAALNELDQAAEWLRAEVSAANSRATQLATELETSHLGTQVERQAAELARTELAKAELRLEALPRLESELERLRIALDAERTGRVAAELAAAVSAVKLEKTEAEITEWRQRYTKLEEYNRGAP